MNNRILLSEDELSKIRNYIIDNYIRNPDVMFNLNDDNQDLINAVVGLYDILHITVTGEHYDYMWHWANKIGAWCDDLEFGRNVFSNLGGKNEKA